MKQLEDYLHNHAMTNANKKALVCGNESVTYRQLYERTTARASLLKEKETRAIVMRTAQTIDFLTTYFAAHLAGKVIVPLEYTITDSHIFEIETLIKDCDIPSDVADILFTTGTTGKSRGAMITHEAIIANAENLIDAQRFADEHVFVISGPLNHIGSLSKIWPMIVVGGTVIITNGMKDIERFFNAFDYPCAKIATFLVPASLRMLMQFAKERLRSYSSKIDFIETGAAPMPQKDMESLCNLLPNTRLYNTYASTETGIISTHDYQNDGCIAGCLGRPMKHSKITILPDGVISCGGLTLMKGYVGDDNLTDQRLHGGIFVTSDTGYIDEKLRLRLCGRVDDMINVGGFKVSPVEVENVVMQYPNIADCICISEKHPILSHVLKLIYVIKKKEEFDKKSLIEHLKRNLETYKIPLFYEQSDKIERTYNGKLNRKYYMN